MKNKITYSLIALLFVMSGHVAKATKENNSKPTVFTIGDSTVKHGRGNGRSGRFGWGEAIDQYFDRNKVNFENHAVGGTSSRTYRDKGYWNAVLEKLKPGDFVLMQFGHNDSSPINDDSRARGTIKGVGAETEKIDNRLTGKQEVVHSYGWYMTQFIEETKSKGATPIIISPIPRNSWNDDGKMNRNNKNSYGEWAKLVAKKEGILFIDLNAMMCDTLDLIGEQATTDKYFWSWDRTHTMDAGAALAASCLVEAMGSSALSTIKNYLLLNPQINFPVKKNIWIIGDSTVADGSNDSIVGWGKALPMYVDTNMVRINNRARGGRSSRSFRQEGLWQAVLEEMRAGDVLLMEFGHNDSGKIDEPKYRGSIAGMGDSTITITRDGKEEVVHTYGWYMSQYVKEAKEKGLSVILISPIARSRNTDGVFERMNKSYGAWTRQEAKKQSVPFIDLNTEIARLYDAMGENVVKEMFPRFPRDRTHTNLSGARLNAYLLASRLRELKENEISQFISIK